MVLECSIKLLNEHSPRSHAHLHTRAPRVHTDISRSPPTQRKENSPSIVPKTRNIHRLMLMNMVFPTSQPMNRIHLTSELVNITSEVEISFLSGAIFTTCEKKLAENRQKLQGKVP